MKKSNTTIALEINYDIRRFYRILTGVEQGDVEATTVVLNTIFLIKESIIDNLKKIDIKKLNAKEACAVNILRQKVVDDRSIFNKLDMRLLSNLSSRRADESSGNDFSSYNF